MQPSFQQIAELFQLSAPIIHEEDTVTENGAPANPRERGALSLSEGDYAAAIRHFRTAVQTMGEPSADVYADLGAAYEYGDFAPEAFRQYLRSQKLNAEQPEPLLGIAELYKRHGRYRDAIAKAQEALELDPTNAFLHYKLGEILREMGEKERALGSIGRAIVLKPDDSFYHFWSGDLLIEMGRFEEALNSLRAAIELSPGDDYLYLRASVAFWRAGKHQEAVKSIRLASDLDPSKHLYHGLLEMLLEEMGLLEEAELEAARADKMDRYDHDLMDRAASEMGIEL